MAKQEPKTVTVLALNEDKRRAFIQLEIQSIDTAVIETPSGKYYLQFGAVVEAVKELLEMENRC